MATDIAKAVESAAMVTPVDLLFPVTATDPESFNRESMINTLFIVLPEFC